jgi:hypothetical protein
MGSFGILHPDLHNRSRRSKKGGKAEEAEEKCIAAERHKVGRK